MTFKRLGRTRIVRAFAKGEPFRPDELREGYYRRRITRGGPFLPLHVWNGPPSDPDTGELLDRSWRWQALFDNTYVDPWSIWPPGEAITVTEYEHLLRLRAWAKEHAPQDPYADPTKKIDLTKVPPIYKGAR